MRDKAAFFFFFILERAHRDHPACLTVPSLLPPVEIQMTGALLKLVHQNASQLFDLQKALFERAETQRLSLLVMLYEAVGAAGTGASLVFTKADFPDFCPSLLDQTKSAQQLVQEDFFPAVKVSHRIQILTYKGPEPPLMLWVGCCRDGSSS